MSFTSYLLAINDFNTVNDLYKNDLYMCVCICTDDEQAEVSQ